MALLVTSLALAITASLVPAAQGKPLTPATLPGEHGHVVQSSSNAAPALSADFGGLQYGTGNPDIWTLPQAPDDRGSAQGIGNAATTQARSDDRGFAQGMDSLATTASTGSGSSFDWTNVLVAIGGGLGLIVLVAAGVATSQRRHSGKLAV